MEKKKSKQNVLVIVRTGIFIALLISVQYLTASLGQLVTGSVVNLVLILAAITCGLYGGLSVAVISPAIAYLFGIGPVFVQIIPVIMLGNAVLVAIWHFLLKTESTNKVKLTVRSVIAAVLAAFAKLGVLYFGVVKIALTLINDIKPKQVEKLSAMFTWPQLFTALIGGALAVIIIPVIISALKGRKQA